jgi:hypothetical protein
MPAYLNDAVYNPRIVAALIAEGWTLSRAARGKVVTGKPARNPRVNPEPPNGGLFFRRNYHYYHTSCD